MTRDDELLDFATGVNFDESREDLPWFDVRLFRNGPGSVEHFECFDTAHVPGRCLDALLYGKR